MRIQHSATVLAVAALLAGGPPAGADEKDPVTRAAAEFDYPDAASKLSTKAGPIRQTTLTTADGFDRVLRWYGRKLGATWPEPAVSNGAAVQPAPGRWTVLAHDSTQKARGARPRPVRVSTLVRDAKGYCLTLAVTRADGEDETHIIVTYVARP